MKTVPIDLSFDTGRAYDLKSVPLPVLRPERDGDTVTNKGAGYLWSGEGDLPGIGQRVFVSMNGLGYGTVTAYLYEAGWLGVFVRLEDAPEWHRRQTAGRTQYPGIAMVYGAELGKGPA